MVAALRGVRRPVRDAHGAAGGHGRGEEGPGVGEVRLHGHVQAGHGPGLDAPLPLAHALSAHAGAPQHLQRHPDVRQGRHPAGGIVAQHEGGVEAHRGQQQCGDELRGAARIDRDRPAGDGSGADDAQRQGTPTTVLHPDTELPQPLDHGSHGTHPGGVVAVEDDRARAQGGHGGHEAHDRARESAVHGHGPVQHGARGHGVDPQVRAERARTGKFGDRGAQLLERGDHQGTVP